MKLPLDTERREPSFGAELPPPPPPADVSRPARPPRPPFWSPKRLKILAIVSGLLLTLLGVGYVIAMRMAEGKVRTLLAKIAPDAKYDAITFSFSGAVRLTGFSATPRPGLALALDQLDVHVRWSDALSGVPLPSEVALSGLTATVDLDALKDGKASNEATEASSGLRAKLLDNPPAITLDGGTVKVSRGGKEVLALSELNGAATPSELGLDFTGTGLAAIHPADLELPFAARGILDPKAKKGSIRLMGEGGEPLAGRKTESNTLTLSAIEAAFSQDHLQLVAQGLTAQHGDGPTPLVKAEIDLVVADLIKGQKTRLSIDGGRISLDGKGLAAKLSEHRSLAMLRDVLGEVEERDEPITEPIKVKGKRRAKAEPMAAPDPAEVRRYELLARALKVLDQVEVYGRGFEIVVLRDEARYVVPRLSVAEDLGFEVHGNTISGTVNVLGGLVRGALVLEPGLLDLQSLDLELEGLDLGLLGLSYERHWQLPDRRPSRALGGRLDANLQVAAVPNLTKPGLKQADTLIDLSLRLREGVAFHPSVSEEPLYVDDVRGALAARFSPSTDVLFVTHSELTTKKLIATLQVLVDDLRGDPVVRAEGHLGPVACQDAMDALPVGLLGPYSATFEGELSPALHLTWPVFRPYYTFINLKKLKLDTCRVTSMKTRRDAWPDVKGAKELSDVFWLNEPFVKRVEEGVIGDEEIFVGPGVPGYVSIASLPGHAGGAAYLSEEMDFFRQGGFSKGLMLRALRLNLDGKRFVYGGSTVTQQLVKNLFLTRTKTLARKVRELLISARIAEAIPKERVLELYLNCIEFGPNVFGLGRGAQYYFQKDARQLTPTESIFLAMLKPYPRGGGGMKKNGTTPGYPMWTDRTFIMLQRLVDAGYITPEQGETEKPFLPITWDSEGKYIDPRVAGAPAPTPPAPTPETPTPAVPGVPPEGETPTPPVVPIPALPEPVDEDAPPPPGQE